MLKLGNTEINKLYLGTTEVTKCYLGNTQVYEKQAAPVGEVWEVTCEYLWDEPKYVTSPNIGIQRVYKVTLGIDSAIYLYFLGGDSDSFIVHGQHQVYDDMGVDSWWEEDMSINYGVYINKPATNIIAGPSITATVSMPEECKAVITVN